MQHLYMYVCGVHEWSVNQRQSNLSVTAVYVLRLCEAVTHPVVLMVASVPTADLRTPSDYRAPTHTRSQ